MGKSKVLSRGFYIHPLSFVISTKRLLKTIFRLNKARVCPIGFRQLLCHVCFDLLVERLSFFAVSNRFKLRCMLNNSCHCITKSVLVITAIIFSNIWLLNNHVQLSLASFLAEIGHFVNRFYNPRESCFGKPHRT